ncbi:ATP-binding protein [Demequina pelophila]|uniref:ATP-binding protein n=1 Tax=Demequina pelophila TaxID=1638984 RepID=UPI0007836475|nr:sensor histidine kinase [Demequina pelophila]
MTFLVANSGIEPILEDIPRLLTAGAEWGACVVYITLTPKRLDRLPLIGVIVAGLFALVGVQLLAGALHLGWWWLGMVMAAATMYGLVWACTDTEWQRAGDRFVRAFVLAELAASLAWQIDQHFFVANGWPWERFAAVAVMLASALAAAWFAERRNFPPERRVAIDSRMFLATLSIGIVTFLMSNLSFVTDESPFVSSDHESILYIRTLVDLCGFVALYAMRAQRLQLQRAIDNQSMNSLLRAQHAQYEQSRRMQDSVNRKYHDLKHFATALRGEGDAQVRASLVDQLEDTIRGYDVVYDTGNPVVDTMLTAKVSQAQDLGITFTCVVDGHAVDFMEVADIVAIFGNALDNAIEATRKVPDPDQRLCRVALHRQGGFALLRFENYFGGELDLDDGLPRTTKDDQAHHGYGLLNTRQAVERYDGTFTVAAEDGWFVMRVLVPIPS